MPSVYDLKPRFQNLLRPIVGKLVALGFVPNTITCLALIGSILIGFWVSRAKGNAMFLLLLAPWLFVRMALNAIDGMMAREFHMETHLGAVLNEVGDVLSDVSLYIPLAFAVEESAIPIVVFCIGAILTEFCGLLGKSLGANRGYEGPMGKSDRALLIGLLTIITVVFSQTQKWWWWIFIIASGLEILTCVNRVRASLLVLQTRSEDFSDYKKPEFDKVH